MRGFLTDSRNIERSGVLWNMIGSMVVAFRSVVLLVVMGYTVDIVYAGIFTIGNTDGNLMLGIGKYGVRNYQVSDVEGRYSFEEYRRARVRSCIMMITATLIYVTYMALRGSYDMYKYMTVIWTCLFMVPDAYEDVYYGEYQRRGRLDIGAKALSVRAIFNMVLMSVLIIATRDILVTMIVTTVVTTVVMLLLIRATKTYAEDSCSAADAIAGRESGSTKHVREILATTFPLMVISLLTMYISAAPRNSIDRYMTDEVQAVYGYIAMPIFVIGLAASFVFNPIYNRLSHLYYDGELRRFVLLIVRQLLVIAGITLICIAGAWLIGIPVLSVMYNTDLSEYKTDLLLILVGGAFLAAAAMLGSVITIFRYQKYSMAGDVVVAVTASFVCDVAVSSYGIRGAVVIYILLEALLCVIFAGITAVGVLRKRQEITAV